MASFDPHLPQQDETNPVLPERRHAAEEAARPQRRAPRLRRSRRWLTLVVWIAVILLALAAGGLFALRAYLRHAMQASLPQVDGTLPIPGIGHPVTVLRDAQGVPHIRAASMDDLVFAQGYITAQDRLWQMETLRRHAAGTLAEILGSKLVEHDRMQRLLELDVAADRALAALPADQRHWLEVYARGVNASIAAQRDHLPAEFRLLRFTPAPWTPRDSLLCGLVMFEDLTNSFPTKMARETVAAKLPPQMVADLYPVGSWRDHPVVQPMVDLSAPVESIEEIPLDASQLGELRPPQATPQRVRELLEVEAKIGSDGACDGCRAGSNDWVVAGSKTASGKPLLSNDMHLSHGVPGIWYEADLEAPSASGGEFHVAGVTLPGVPFVLVGHNDHVAWGFTNLGADVQDLYIERTRGEGDSEQFQAPDGGWQPMLHRREVIHVHHGRDVTLDIPETRHDSAVTPVISALYPGERRTISLRWTIYDPTTVTLPFFAVDSAADGQSLVAAFSTFGGPAQNVVYADDQGHIGYHAVGRIPLRGDPSHPTPPSPVPDPSGVPDSEWSTVAPYIPYDQLPQVTDPASGVLATANARVVPDSYPYPITENWAAPYRNERIWKVLAAAQQLRPADMLRLQTDVYSDVDHVIAQRLAYAIDHASLPKSRQKELRQAADLLRRWDGQVKADEAAPAIVDSTREALWTLLLKPRLGDAAALYRWGEKPFAEEQLVAHTPARWLPPHVANWDQLFVEAVLKGLHDYHAPSDLSRWQYGRVFPVEIRHPLFGSSPLLRWLAGMPTGVGPLPQSGDRTTVKQVGRSFGPSERFTADLANLDDSTLNVVMGESGDPASPWFRDQWNAWYTGKTFPLPFSDAAVRRAATHTLVLTPR